jgi:hypothetical protein
MFADLDTVNGTSLAITAKIGGSSVSAQIIPYTVNKVIDFPGKIAKLFLQCTYLYVQCIHVVYNINFSLPPSTNDILAGVLNIIFYNLRLNETIPDGHNVNLESLLQHNSPLVMQSLLKALTIETWK